MRLRSAIGRMWGADPVPDRPGQPGPRAAAPPAARGRFGAMPAWVLLPQLFLASGWLRAGIANAVTAGWWDGAGVRTFLAEETDLAVPFYEPVLALVESLAVPVAVVVCVAELVIAALLLLDRWPLAALAAGAFLNVQFVVAGVVNPSAFYLVIAMVVVLWHLDHGGSAATYRVAARAAVAAAVVATLTLAPFVSTLRPAEVIRDPALVLVFLSALFAVAVAWARRQSAAG
jgi:thiosulfate dehydrogenase [quinone] large subunit